MIVSNSDVLATVLMPSVLAITAHPDDIEFVAAGTLLRLQALGWDLHYFNLCRGNCGSVEHDGDTTATIRLAEARAAAAILGATFYAPIVNDLEVVYSVDLLRQVSAVIRQARPQIVLTHSPQDYMEDHMITARLAVTAAFTHAMPNWRTVPAVEPYPGDVTVYHAMPHGLQDGLRQPITPDFYVDTSAVHAQKRAALAAHHSQKHWLDVSQGMDSYLVSMDEASSLLGRLSGSFEHAEGWRRHSHLGFCSAEADPLRALLA
jgi:N-acetylglucosamine malate deacetylase 1